MDSYRIYPLEDYPSGDLPVWLVWNTGYVLNGQKGVFDGLHWKGRIELTVIFEPGDRVQVRGNHPVYPLKKGTIAGGTFEEMYMVRLDNGMLMEFALEELSPL